MPYFARPAPTSGVPHLTKISALERVTHRIKMVMKMGALVVIVVLATRGLELGVDTTGPGASRFERAGSNGMVQITGASSLSGSSERMPGTSGALLTMVGAATGVDLRAMVSDTGRALESFKVGQ